MLGLAAIVGHMFGDYVLQNGWMAMNKGKRGVALLVHCLLYTLSCWGVLLFVGVSLPAWAILVVFWGHAALDGSSVVAWFWGKCNGTDPKTIPLFLRILIDNTIHLATLLVVLVLMGGLT